MQNKRKQGQVCIEGVNSSTFVESSEGPLKDWTPDQEATANVVLASIKSYTNAIKSLANGKYDHLRDKIPEYMVAPGNVIIAVCADGVVIRYERREQETPNIGVMVMQEGIAYAASKLSQNLVHIQSQEVPQLPDEDFGIEFKMSFQSPLPGASHDIISDRIWFQVTNNTIQQGDIQLGAKPYCLLSVRNQLDLEIHGEMLDSETKAPSQPFIARSSLRLTVGWECLEVFPGLNLSAWNVDYAPLWAERDILGAVLIAQTKDARLSSLDPRATSRHFYASLLGEFKALLDSNPDREQVLQAFLQKNPILLCPTHVRMWPKLPLGATITDFVFREANQEYILVELERSTLQLFRQDGHATADLTHAQGQIVDWKRYLEDNLQTVQRELGLAGITPNPNGLLVIGRSQSLRSENRRKLQTMANESPKLRIMTYDDVYENAKAVFENLLGPIWDTGGTTQIYYPNS